MCILLVAGARLGSSALAEMPSGGGLVSDFCHGIPSVKLRKVLEDRRMRNEAGTFPQKPPFSISVMAFNLEKSGTSLDVRCLRSGSNIHDRVETFDDTGSEEESVQVGAVPKKGVRGVLRTLTRYKPAGPLKGKSGPAKTKFDCFLCKQTRWITDSEAGCAANLTRLSTCLFCDLRAEFGRGMQELKASLSSGMREVRDSFEIRLSDLEGDRGRQTVDLGSPSGSKIADLGERFDRLGNEVRGIRVSFEKSIAELGTAVDLKLADLERDLERGLTRVAPPSPLPHPEASSSPATVGANLQRILLDLDKSVENAHRRHSLPPTSHAASRVVVPRPLLEPKAGPVPSGTCPVMMSKTAVATKRKRTKRRKRKRRRKKKSGDVVSRPRDAPSRLAPVVLFGDSMVGKETGRLFSSLREETEFRSLPGARVDQVKREMGKLDLDRDSTLVLSVGGNDLFRRDGRPGPTDKLLTDFSALLLTAKSRVNRCIVVGLIPRRYASAEHYRRACDVNKRLAELCRSLSLRYVDVWRRFFRRNEFYQRDGTHFSEAGAREFVSLIGPKLFKPTTMCSPKPSEASARPPVRGVDDDTARKNLRPSQRIVRGTGSSLTVTRRVVGTSSCGTQTSTPSQDTAKRQRSMLSDGSPSPNQQLPLKRRKDSGGGSQNGDPPEPGNGSPSGDGAGP